MNEKHLIYRIIEYGQKEQFFTYPQLKAELNLSPDEDGYVYNTMIHWDNEATANHLIAIVKRNFYTGSSGHSLPVIDNQKSILGLLPTAIFQYNDYLEIIQARKSAQEAKRLSWYAIWISIGLGVGQIIISYMQLK